MVSLARIRLASRRSVRTFKGIICDDVSEFESYMPSHAVRSQCVATIRCSRRRFGEEHSADHHLSYAEAPGKRPKTRLGSAGRPYDAGSRLYRLRLPHLVGDICSREDAP